MIREMAINVTVKLGDIGTQFTEKLRSERPTDAVARSNNDLHFTSDLNIISNAFQVFIFNRVLSRTSIALGVVFVADALRQILYFLFGQRLLINYRFEAVIFSWVVAACHHDATRRI